MADFEGQKLCERLSIALMIIFTIISCSTGFILQSFPQAVKILLFGSAVTCAVCLPEWGVYNRNPIKFLGFNYKTD
eukprot:maker-scaffold_11-snap-gene-10.8-mRNA-1 protein AED:0.42 eAED:0.42 QI:42/1/1/1/1/1/3/6/75